MAELTGNVVAVENLTGEVEAVGNLTGNIGAGVEYYKGKDGIDGKSVILGEPTITISAIGPEESATATVAVTGDDSAKIFAFSFQIPSGIGPKGDKGDAFTYEDYTPEQLAALKGPQGDTGAKGDKGDKGDAFIYSDFTPEQLTLLTGPKGDKGDAGVQGIKGDKGDTGAQGIQGPIGETGPKGDKGDAFLYADFTPEQLAALQGPKGDKGDTGTQGTDGAKGDAFTYADFTTEQLAALKGPQGDVGTAAEISIGSVLTGTAGTDATVYNSGDAQFAILNFTIPQGLTGIQGAKGDKGDKGDTGAQGIQGIQGLQGIQGEKGDAFIYTDFTVDQLAALKGEKGDKGDTGAQGPQGEQGPQGIQGIQGETGPVGTVEGIDGLFAHLDASICNEAGAHNFRYYNGVFSYLVNSVWTDIEVGGGGGTISLPPMNVSNFKLTVGNSQLTLKWNDPDDTILSDQTIVTWAGTKIIRKAGSVPLNDSDGVLIYDNQVRNAFATTGLSDTGLTNGVTYYYQAFPYSSDGAVNSNEANRISGVPTPTVTYGVRIDTTNSNPETAVTYTDDAVGMVGGSVDWGNKFPFNKIKPCLLKNGVVQYYLNPSDYTKKADGTAANITSGADGDVMIEIPKMAYMIYTEGNYVYVKITNDINAKVNDSRYCYYAHTRTTEGDRNNLYVGAYLGYYNSTSLRSLSGNNPSNNQTINIFRIWAQANGTGYDLLSFYPLTLLQCLYVIRYKNLDSQTKIGRGYVDGNSAALPTGGTNTKGMNYGETTGKLQMKFLGIEDFWGNLKWFIDGLYSDVSLNMMTAFTSFNDAATGYTNRGVGRSSGFGYMNKIQGTNETGFIPKENNGSTSTYFTDFSGWVGARVPAFGSHWGDGSACGAFFLYVGIGTNEISTSMGGRLMYL